jgi:6-phosphogluconolactonase (cycloisomerase 2 family)
MYLKKMGRTTEVRPAARTAKTAAGKVAGCVLPLAALSLAFGLTACTRDYTLAYLYVTTSKASPGVINQYTVDYQSGALVQIGTPVAAGVNPVASVAAPNASAIYVVNQGDSTVQEFAVGSGGLLTAKTAVSTTGNTPTAIAIDTAGKFLFVTCKYQGTNTSGAGALSVFPVGTDGSLGSAVNVNLGNNPVSVAIANFNPTVYVVDQDPATPQVLAFAENTTSGALTPISGAAVPGATTANGFAAGVQPSAVAEDPTGRFVYVTDQAANQLIGYIVLTGGGLQPMVNGPFATSLYPVAVLVDPRGKYIYVANYNSRTISAYTLNSATGTPSGVAGTTVTTDPNPVAIALDPALGIYLYTANNLGSTVTGEQLNASTGVLSGIQNSPFPASGNPTSVVIVANGSHPTEVLLQ